MPFASADIRAVSASHQTAKAASSALAVASSFSLRMTSEKLLGALISLMASTCAFCSDWIEANENADGGEAEKSEKAGTGGEEGAVV